MRLMTIAVLAAVPVLGTNIDVDSGPFDPVRTTGPTVTITGNSATLTQSVFAASGSSYTYENTINLLAAGTGAGYLSIFYFPDNEISGFGSASSAVRISGAVIPSSQQIQLPVTLGQPFFVLLRTSATGGPIAPAFGSSAVSVFIDAFNSANVPVNLSLQQVNPVGVDAPEPATEGLAGAGILAVVLRIRRKLW